MIINIIKGFIVLGLMLFGLKVSAGAVDSKSHADFFVPAPVQLAALRTCLFYR